MEYDPQNFSDVYRPPLGPNLWEFLNAQDNVVRMETATYLKRVAVEPLSPFLIERFGDQVRENRIKQMVGHMVRQILEARGHHWERGNVQIRRDNLFTTGSRYTYNG